MDENLRKIAYELKEMNLKFEKLINSLSTAATFLHQNVEKVEIKCTCKNTCTCKKEGPSFGSEGESKQSTK